MVSEFIARRVIEAPHSETLNHQPPKLAKDFMGLRPNAMRSLKTLGVCVSFGNSAYTDSTIDTVASMLGRTRLIGIYLLPVLDYRKATEGFECLFTLLEKKALRPCIEVGASWNDIRDIAKRFMRREIAGKVVLHLN